ncbi:MAG: V-type ATPase 116kDa subunit family protein [Candidatus Omnitrophica bacterium]|nr:V-type ATPase 116kDa subunit family protein [Candidatus Omnitrophota bacterium]
MIVEMKKLTILVSEEERKNLLIALRKLGAIHVRNMEKKEGERLSELEEKINYLKKAIIVVQKTDIHPPEIPMHLSTEAIEEVAREICVLDDEKQEKIKDIKQLDEKMGFFRPWGSFDPVTVRQLKDQGVNIKFYLAPKNKIKEIQKEKNKFIVHIDNSQIYFVQYLYGEDRSLEYKQISLPKYGYEIWYEKKQEEISRIDAINISVEKRARALEDMKEHLRYIEEKYEFYNVHYGMKEQKEYSFLQGFCPNDKVEEIKEMFKMFNVGYVIETPSETEEVPTLVRNAKWISIVEPIFNFMGTVPGYKEYDISMWFLLFFSLFFAMLVGDAGYGVLFLAITALCQKKFKKVPKQPFFLMYVLSISTIIWGALTGTWFGSETIANIPILKKITFPQLASFDPVGDSQSFLIHICFVIGVIQLTIGRVMVFFRKIPSLKAIAEIGWISILWSLFFLADLLVLGKAMPVIAMPLLGAGTLLVLFFANFQKNILKGAMSTIGNLPLDIVGRFSDVVSYLRLFAVGYASVIVASSFNQMGMEVGFNSFVTGLGAAMIILFGHILNIVLALMAVIVHGVRLNMLEFSGQMSMEWAGQKYSPFKEKETIEI